MTRRHGPGRPVGLGCYGHTVPLRGSALLIR
jgi:hypothetical protein